MELGNSKYTLEELHSILGYFAIAQDSFQLQPLTSGYINDTFLVFAGQKPLYILQRINHLVFKNTNGLMSNVSIALNALISDDYATIKLISTQEQSYFTKGEEGYWRLMSFIPGSTTFNNTEDKQIAFEAGRIVGKFHLLLQNKNPSEFVDTVPHFHDLSYREKEFEEALLNAKDEKLKIADIAISFAKNTLVQIKGMYTDELPLRVCHNDTKLNNILFSKSSDKALCLIDLDTIMKGYFFYDFGDAVRTIANTAPEGEQDYGKIIFDKELFASFVKGLASNGSFLTKEELHSLPLGVVFMPFIHGLRALTDYLNNNIYYKVTYANQNLDRCLSLFNFTQKALDNISFVERSILESFSDKVR